jgi:hypothetical protein
VQEAFQEVFRGALSNVPNRKTRDEYNDNWVGGVHSTGSTIKTSRSLLFTEFIVLSSCVHVSLAPLCVALICDNMLRLQERYINSR